MILYEIECNEAAFLKLSYFYSQYPKTALLLSRTDPFDKSYLFLFPYQEIMINSCSSDPWDQLKAMIGEFDSSALEVPKWVGYLSYEMSAFSDADKKLAYKPLPIPLAYFLKPAIVCIFANQTLSIVINEEAEPSLTGDLLVEYKRFLNRSINTYWIESLPSFSKSHFQMKIKSESDTYKSYVEKMKQAKNYIRLGEIYQVNLSRSIMLETSSKAADLFYKLYSINPTPFAAFLDFESFQIISASPERFLKFSSNTLETRPIKGTIARGTNLAEDQMRRKTLEESIKDDAELMMICDLMRNDLGKISEIHSVKCIERKKTITLSNVFHLESIITSTPKPLHPIDMLRACFPAGSITGCPKLRAQEIIYELEQRSRHIYSGSIGYFLHSGHFDFNVAIRTALLKDQQLEVQVGGAITFDSNLEEEYQETAHKGNPFFQIFNSLVKSNAH